ncbi:uncharacterized protein LOC113516271 [Galleria mellonella]|uniref:Uncharacterized protein LOC113516271 n=1 Tax=Galleria mellonella TaxID=7137 RepID=A0A6J1WN26_GALME|nr:uncharacterized protein LOC113516271 [Galleria mellonella]
MANLTLLVPVLFLALFVEYGNSVSCWTCSSDINPFCNDPFLAGRGEYSGQFQLENCDGRTGVTFPYLSSSKSACKKQKKYVNGLLVVTRGCTWKRTDDYSNQCPNYSSSTNEIPSFCETCDYDGCNGAATIGTTLALLLAPLGLLLFK